MARTPLLRTLLRLIEEQRSETGRDAGSLPLSRRRLLAGASMGAAGLLLEPPALAAPRGVDERVVIVGGGIAGLTAAVRLTDAHVPCVVYEASGRIGGRMFSHSPQLSGAAGYWDDGQVTEWCGELIDSSHATILALARRFGVTPDDVRAAEPAGSREVFHFGGERYLHADRDFAPVYQAVQRDSAAAGYPTSYRRRTAAGIALDRMSVHEWITTRVPGGHGSKLGRLLDVAYTVEYGSDTRDQSALNLVYMLGGSERKPLEVFGASDERYHLRGGNQRLPVAMAAALPRGMVRTGRRLTRLVSEADGSVSLTFESASLKETVTADRVILALPFAVLRTLDIQQAGFDNRKQVAIQELGAGRTAKLMVQFAERVWTGEAPGGAGNGATFTDLPYQASWDVTRGQSGKSGVLVGYAGGPGVRPYHNHAAPYTTARNSATNAAAAGFAGQLDAVFPGAQEEYNGKAHLATPYQDPHFRCSYSYYRVGQYHRFGGYEKVRQRSIHFAGEHCSQDYQGFMEGGASEGLRAANEVLAVLKGAAARPR